MTITTMSSSLPPTDCSSPSLAHPSFSNFIVSVVIFLGILGSYLPQHYRIISRKTSEGISPFFLLLGVTSGTCGLANIWILGSGVVGCCSSGDLGKWRCAAGMMGILQVTMQWACFAIILILFLLYFPFATPALPTTTTETTINPVTHIPHKHPVPSPRHPSTTLAYAITLLSIAHFIVIVAISGCLYSHDSSHLLSWANSLGVQSTLLASLQYIPQIYTTFKLQRVGSLSIPMMCIQTPGSFVWAASLAVREGTKWSSWLVYVVTGSLQGCLLVMCIWFEMRDARERKAEEREEEEARRLLSEAEARVENGNAGGAYGTTAVDAAERRESRDDESLDEETPLLARSR